MTTDNRTLEELTLALQRKQPGAFHYRVIVCSTLGGLWRVDCDRWNGFGATVREAVKAALEDT